MRLPALRKRGVGRLVADARRMAPAPDGQAMPVALAQAYWLSFVREGAGWLGAVVVQGDTMVEAVKTAHALKINPGGEVVGVKLTMRQSARVGEKWRNRLLDAAACEALDHEVRGLLAEWR